MEIDTHSGSLLDSQTHGDECGSGSHIGRGSQLIYGKRITRRIDEATSERRE